jgi:hypothetical protein
MPFRFRKSFKLGKGIKLNLSKSGLSTSIGGKGLSLNVGKRGIRATTNLPGTGISHSTDFLKNKKHPTSSSEPTTATHEVKKQNLRKWANRITWFIVIAFSSCFILGLILSAIASNQ